jgi:ABC-type phosphate transport system substrate-binding protein
MEMKISLVALLVLLLSVSALAEAPAYRVIVHPSSEISSLTRDQLADAFLKKITRWPSGEAIRPVDLHSNAAAREKFARDVLRRSLAAVRSYWQQLIFSGRNIPPPELESDAAVLAYVLRYPGAIGYVSGDVDIADAKVIAVK